MSAQQPPTLANDDGQPIFVGGPDTPPQAQAQMLVVHMPGREQPERLWLYGFGSDNRGRYVGLTRKGDVAP